MLFDNRLHLAPLVSPKKIMDIGTGTGIWAIECAKMYPDAHVIGTDLSMIRKYSFSCHDTLMLTGGNRIEPLGVVPNCTCYLENSETEDWDLFPDHTNLDFVHMRGMGPCFNSFWGMVQKVYKNLRPGGWIELQDMLYETLSANDGQPLTSDSGSALARLFPSLAAGMAILGRDVHKSRLFKEYLTSAGFVDIEERRAMLPMSPWPSHARGRRLAYYMSNAIQQSVDSYRRVLLQSGMTPDEFDLFMRDLRRESLMKDHPHRPYGNM
jgi:metalloendopeptidase OMA1, mitochondrial